MNIFLKVEIIFKFSPIADSKASVLMIRTLSHILSDFSIFTGPYTHGRLKFNTLKTKSLSFDCICQSTNIGDGRILFAVVGLVYLGKYGLSVNSYFPAPGKTPYPGKRKGMRQGYQIMLRSYACPIQGHSAMTIKGCEVRHVVPPAYLCVPA